MMTEGSEEVQHDIRATRQRLDATIDEIESRFSDGAAEVKRRIDLRRYARENPWTVLGAAVGAGLLIGVTGADRTAASAALGLVQRGTGDTPAVDPATAGPCEDQREGIGEQLDGAIEGLFFEGLTQMILSLRRDSLTEARPSSRQPSHRAARS
jgi:ElaB/YqjD/DUF883 family membrane-anchored ribosome-binding protein